jgi:hypothetical protein
MPNDKPGNHPLSDILIYNIETYGPDVDKLIRGVSELSSRHELYEWWKNEINGSTDREFVAQKAEARYVELMQRSSNSGWGSH